MYLGLFLLCSLIYLTASVYASGSGKEQSSMFTNTDGDDMERRVISLAKRAGARSFGPRFRDFESYFYPNTKRHETFSPYYYYQQPKRAGARAFYSYWNPPADREGRFYEESPFFRKRALLTDDYAY